MSNIVYKEWRPDCSGFPEGDRLAQIRFLLRFAILAPSGHNMQPWCYRIDEASETLVVRLEPSRLLPVSDPADRISYLAVGGTSQCFVRAAEAYGLATKLTIVQSGDVPEVHIAIEGPLPAGRKGSTDWIDAILRRVSDRRMFRKEPISQDVQAFLTGVDVPDTEIRTYSSPEQKKIIAKLTEISSRKLINAKAFRNELADCINGHVSGYGLGMPASSLCFPALLSPFAKFIIRHANIGSALASMATKQLEAAPLIVGVITREETPYHWIRAGMAHLDVFLRTTAQGLGFDTFAAATCDMDARTALARELGFEGYPQILFRIGKSVPGAPARAPRLPVEQVLA